MMKLSASRHILTIRLAVLTQYQRVTDEQTDGRTDGIAVSISHVASTNE